MPRIGHAVKLFMHSWHWRFCFSTRLAARWETESLMPLVHKNIFWDTARPQTSRVVERARSPAGGVNRARDSCLSCIEWYIIRKQVFNVCWQIIGFKFPSVFSQAISTYMGSDRRCTPWFACATVSRLHPFFNLFRPMLTIRRQIMVIIISALCITIGISMLFDQWQTIICLARWRTFQKKMSELFCRCAVHPAQCWTSAQWRIQTRCRRFVLQIGQSLCTRHEEGSEFCSWVETAMTIGRFQLKKVF